MKDYVEVCAPLMVFNHVISSHIDLVKQNELNSPRHILTTKIVVMTPFYYVGNLYVG